MRYIFWSRTWNRMLDNSENKGCMELATVMKCLHISLHSMWVNLWFVITRSLKLYLRNVKWKNKVSSKLCGWNLLHGWIKWGHYVNNFILQTETNKCINQGQCLSNNIPFHWCLAKYIHSRTHIPSSSGNHEWIICMSHSHNLHIQRNWIMSFVCNKAI